MFVFKSEKDCGQKKKKKNQRWKKISWQQKNRNETQNKAPQIYYPEFVSSSSSKLRIEEKLAEQTKKAKKKNPGKKQDQS